MHFLVNPDDDFDMDNVRTKVEESDDEMENLAPAPKRGRGRGSRGKFFNGFHTSIYTAFLTKIQNCINKKIEKEILLLPTFLWLVKILGW